MFFKLAIIFLVFLWFFNLNQGLFIFAQENSQVEDLATLRQKRQDLQKEIDEIRQELDEVRAETKSLQREINILNLEIKELNKGIEEENLAVKEIGIAIKEKEAKVAELEVDVEQKKIFIKETIRQIHDQDQLSFVEIVLGQESLAEFFDNLKYLEDTQESLASALDEVKQLKESLLKEKEALENEIADHYKLKKMLEQDLAAISTKQGIKKNLMRTKKESESTLKMRLGEVTQALNEIQRYFTALVLKGVRVSTEDIINFAIEASAKTGVRPAFLLAVLEVESRMGANIGTGTWQEDMPKSQHQAFLEITSRLGLDPNDVPVSRRVYSNGRRIMWGGAMGPAQFMPKTWLGYEAEIAALTGSNPPNPWDMRDALHAMALYLANRGANDPSLEASAARAYLSGKSSCYSYVCNNYVNRIQEKVRAWTEYLQQK